MKIGPLGKMAKVFGTRSWKGALKVYGDVKLSWGLKVSWHFSYFIQFSFWANFSDGKL